MSRSGTLELWRNRRVGAGLCQDCGKPNDRAGKRRTCTTCSTSVAKANKEARDAARAAGLCGRCFKESALPEMATCATCKVRAADYQAERVRIAKLIVKVPHVPRDGNRCVALLGSGARCRLTARSGCYTCATPAHAAREELAREVNHPRRILHREATTP